MCFLSQGGGEVVQLEEGAEQAYDAPEGFGTVWWCYQGSGQRLHQQDQLSAPVQPNRGSGDQHGQ